MQNQNVVMMKQVSQGAAPVGLWQRLKAAYKNGSTVEFEGHAWSVTSFRRAAHDKFRSEVATIRRT